MLSHKPSPIRDPFDLFLNLMTDLSRRCARGTSHDLIECTAILRRMLIDQRSLFPVVCKKLDYVPLFTIRDTSKVPPLPVPGFEFHYVGGMLDPHDPFPKLPILSVRLEDFLRVPILRTEQKSISIREFIKYCSNKLGASHLDVAEKADERTIEDMILTASGLKKFGLNWSIIERTLSLIIRIFLWTAIPVWAELSRLPLRPKRVFHYDMGIGRAAVFRAKHWMVCDSMEILLEAGFSWNAFVLVRPENLRHSRRWIYEIEGTDAHGKRVKFGVFVAKGMPLGTYLQIGRIVIELHAPPVVEPMLEDYLAITVNIEFSERTVLGIYLNGVNMGQIERAMRVEGTRFNKHVLGANSNGQKGATLQFKELVGFGSAVTGSDLGQLDRHFEYRRALEKLRGMI